MTALALSLAYLGTLAALCWREWHRDRYQRTVTAVLEQVAGSLDEFDKRSAAWDEAVETVNTLSLRAGLAPKDRKGLAS